MVMKDFPGMKHWVHFVLVLFVSTAILTAQESASTAPQPESPNVPTFKDGEIILLAVTGNVPRIVIYQSPVGKDEFNCKGYSNDYRNSMNCVPYDEDIDIKIWSRKGTNHEVMRVNAKELLDDLQEQIKENPNDKTKWETPRENERGKVTFAFAGIVESLPDLVPTATPAETPAVDESAQIDPPIESLEAPTFKAGLHVFLAVKGSVPRMVIYQSPVGKDEFNDKGFPEDDGYGDNLVPYDNGIDLRIWTRKGTNREVMRFNAKELLDDLQQQIEENPNDKTKWRTTRENNDGEVTFVFTGTSELQSRKVPPATLAVVEPTPRDLQRDSQGESPEVPVFKDGEKVFLTVKGNVPRMLVYQSPIGKNEFKHFFEDDFFGDYLIPYDKDVFVRIWSRKGSNREVMHINAKELLDNLHAHIKENPNNKTKWETTAKNEFGKVTFTYAGTRNFYDLISAAEEQTSANPPPKSWPTPGFFRLSREVAQKISSGDVYLKCWRDGEFQRFSDLRFPRFDNSRTVVVLIHGLFCSSEDKWMADMAARIKKGEPNTEILAVDWSKPALNEIKKRGLDPINMFVDTPLVVTSIPPVAENVHEYLFDKTGLALQPSAIHIIGFSHGAHIGGLVGVKTKGTLRRLTLLDPSARLSHIFTGSNFFGGGWDSQAAKFTDMYRTSYWAGAGKAYGHKSFKVEEEGANKSQKDRHNFATEWFASTIGRRCQYYGYSMTIPEDVPFKGGAWTGTIVVGTSP